MAGSVNNFLSSAIKQPIASGLSAVFGSVALVGLFTDMTVPEQVLSGVISASPFVSMGLGITAVINMSRERSGLSKTFSAAAMITAVSAASPVLTTIGMSAAGAFNVIAHYTKDRNLITSLSTKDEQSAVPKAPAPK